jgi:Tol biopolymer transport system component
MGLQSGSCVGPYEITAQIGVGGMGEVYRARDTRLKREVALKILPESFATDLDRLARSQREAEVLAALNHPHIAAIYGLEESGTTRALVMELVEGPTLADRIARGPIPVDEALPIAKQIAEALEAAHEQGIIHRDLKPANIKVRPDGTVKVLDFGLAKALEPVSFVGLDATASPTITSPAMMTGVGVLLGTAAYMSPEQAKGRPADKRSDLWGFACVLFEMLAGKPPFTGGDVSDTIVSVLRDEPDWSVLPGGTPQGIRTLLRRCLDKDRNRRLDSAVAARIEIDDSLSAPPKAAREATTSWRSAVRVGFAPFVIATTLVLLGLIYLRRQEPVLAPEMRVEINTPVTNDPASFAISPDGEQLVFVASGNGPSRLWLRPLAATTAQPLAGTDGASGPFWSPDSGSVGFFADGKLKRIDLGGAAPRALAAVARPGGGSWNAEGLILFARTGGGPLFRVSASGGEPVPITKLERQASHRYPSFLPDGRRFIYNAAGDAGGLYLGSLDGGPKLLTAPARGGAFLSSGWLLWQRADALVAQRLDLERQELVGDRITIAEPVALYNTTNAAGFSVSATGVIAYRSGGTNRRQFRWFDRTGKELSAVGEADAASLSWPRVSSNGRIVAERNVQGNGDIWVLEETRARRLTFDAASDTNPLWSPDGDRIVFRSRRGAATDLYVTASSGASVERVLLESASDKTPNDWSPDGGFILYGGYDPQTDQDLWVLPLHGDRKPWPFLRTKSAETSAQFSPDGRWVAYQSNESGRFEIYVRPFVASPDTNATTAGAAGQWQVSAEGGTYPSWRSDGKELHYIGPAGQMMSAAVTVVGAILDVAMPVKLFDTRIYGGGGSNGQGRQYDVATDGRFLINTVVDDVATPITLIQNWQPPSK